MSEKKISRDAQLREFLSSAKYIAVAGMLAMSVIASSSCAFSRGSPSSQNEKIPVIFDTDIGGDIDDTWALALLVQSPEFNVKLVTTEVANTRAKAEIVAKFLETVGRTDIPVGIGVQQSKGRHRQQEWTEGYKLSSYPGKIHEDGVQALIDTIMKSPKPIKLIAVGPVPNIAAALEREPRIAEKAEFVGMHGSVYRGYGGSSKISAEYNVRADAKAAQKAFTAP